MMRCNRPSIVRHPKSAWLIAVLCAFGSWHAAIDAAGYELSHGRQVILNRGLQISALASHWGPGAITNNALWNSSNFTTIDWGWGYFNLGDQTFLHNMSPTQQWGRWCYDVAEGPGPLPWPESTYANLNNFVAYEYMEETGVSDLFTDPNRMSVVNAAYRGKNALYPNALAYTTFWGSQYTAAQMTAYVQATHPDLLMFDTYPGFSFATANRNAWYSDMQKFRTVGLAGFDGSGKSPIPYGQYLNLSRSYYSDPLPSESFVHMQQSASWAFGYSMVEAFLYNDPGSGPGGDRDCSTMFNSGGDSSPNVVFGYVAEANRQSRKLGTALIRLVSTDIRMIPGTYSDYTWWQGTHIDTLPLPSGISSWASGHLHGDVNGNNGGNDYITGITPLGKDGGASGVHSDVLIGYFKPLLASNPGCTFVDGLHFMLVNGASQGTAWDATEQYHLTFNFAGTGFDSLVRISRETGKVELFPCTPIGGSNYAIDLYLQGGAGDLFGFWDASNPLPTVPEPGALVLLTVGMLGLSAYAWRKRN
jgi:hypothetical protein